MPRIHLFLTCAGKSAEAHANNPTNNDTNKKNRRRLLQGGISQANQQAALDLFSTLTLTAKLLGAAALPGSTTIAPSAYSTVAVTRNTPVSLSAASILFPAAPDDSTYVGLSMPGSSFSTWCALDSACSKQVGVACQAIHKSKQTKQMHSDSSR
jgi:hypothetical protein